MHFFQRLALHAAFFVIAAVLGFAGMMVVGVRAVGDNPGALFGGAGPFFLALFGLIVLEALWRSRAFRGGAWLSVLLENVLSFGAAFVGLMAALVLLWAQLPALEALGLFFPALLGALAFLALDSALYWLAKAATERLHSHPKEPGAFNAP